MSLIYSLFTIFLLSAVSARRIGQPERSIRSVRVVRDTYVCEGDEGREKFDACLEKARADGKAAVEEPDGRPEQFERYVCNLITEIFQVCGRHLLNECYIEESAKSFLDSVVKHYLKPLEELSDAWDPQKCPVVKDFVERNRPKTSEKNGSEMKSVSAFTMVTISFLSAFN